MSGNVYNSARQRQIWRVVPDLIRARELLRGLVWKDLRARYRYELLPDSKWNIKVGAGFSLLDTEVKLLAGDDVPPGSGGLGDDFFDEGIGTQKYSFVPLAHLHVGARFTKTLGAFAEVDGGANSDDRYIDAAAVFQLFLGKRWQLQIGYRRIERKLESSDLFNEVTEDRTIIGVGYIL